MTNVQHSLRRSFIFRHYYLLGGCFLLLLSLFLFWYTSDRSYYISNDFSYSVNTQTVTSDFDAENDRYLGESYAKGGFFMQLVSQQGADSEVRAVAETEQSGADKATASTRTYEVNSLTGKTETGSYLFAPQHLQKGKSFRYQHVSYPAAAEMQFVGAENRYGIELYHYQSSYSSAGILKAPAHAGFAVPEGKGLEYVPSVQIWVEPQTGWLVSFAEDTTVYLYDVKTEQRGVPAYHFLRTVTDESARQQAQYATVHNLQLTFGQRVVPGILLMIALLLMIAFTTRNLREVSVHVKFIVGFVLASAITGCIGWVTQTRLLTTLFANDIPVNPLILICFTLISCSLFLMIRQVYRGAAVVCAGVVVLLMSAQMLGSLQLIGFRLDDVFFADGSIGASSAVGKSHMSFVSEFLFFILALGIIKALLTKTSSTIRFGRLSASMVVTLSVGALFIKLFLFDKLFSITFIESMSVATLVLFAVSGYALFQALQSIHGHTTQMLSVLRSAFLQGLVALPIIIIAILAQLQQNALQEQLVTEFNAQTSALRSTVETNFKALTNTLIGTKALFSASDTVEREEWHNYLSELHIQQSYPGVQSVGYIQAVSAAQADALVASLRSQGFATFAIFPADTRPTKTAVVYVEPFDSAGQGMLGYNMFADDIRSKAMQQARDMGAPVISEKVQLLQETQNSNQTGFVFFVPVYEKNMPLETDAQRRAALQGYVYSPVVAKEYLASMIPANSGNVRMAIYDGIQPNSTTLLYDNYDRQIPADESVPMTQYATTYVGERPWTIQFTSQPGFQLSSAQARMPGLIFIGGSMFYILLVLVLYSIKALRKRTVTLLQGSERKPKHHESA